MTTVKRVAPGPIDNPTGSISTARHLRSMWREQCLTDLDAGVHAVGCGCVYTEHPYTRDVHHPNACLHIARCALEFKDYEVEE